MNAYASTHNLKYKIPLVFRLNLQLVSIRIRTPKSMSVSFEFTYAKTVVGSKNFHKLEANAYETVLREAVDMPLIVMFDPRKNRFMSQSVEVAVMSNHAGFSKKMGAGSINVAQILNSQTLVSREQTKLEKCFDKNAILNIKATFEFKGTHSGSDLDSLSHSKFSQSTIR